MAFLLLCRLILWSASTDISITNQTCALRVNEPTACYILPSNNIRQYFTLIFIIHRCLYKNMWSQCNVAGRRGRIYTCYGMFCFFVFLFLVSVQVIAVSKSKIFTVASHSLCLANKLAITISLSCSSNKKLWLHFTIHLTYAGLKDDLKAEG